MMRKAIIFDLDGVIIDSEKLHSRAFLPVAKEYGFRLKKLDTGIYHIAGIPEKQNWKILKKNYGIKEKTEVLMRKRSEEYLKLVRTKGVPRPGLMKLLDSLKGYPLAIASASIRRHVDAVVDHFRIRNRFRSILSGEHMKRTKPFPDIYLKTAKIAEDGT
jgi:beta-phosphoglucomutase-like phosphatase (HAD superfamily)